MVEIKSWGCLLASGRLSDHRRVLAGRGEMSGHELLELGDDLARVEALGTHGCAVHDRVASEERELVFEFLQPLFGELVSRVNNPSKSSHSINLPSRLCHNGLLTDTIVKGQPGLDIYPNSTSTKDTTPNNIHTIYTHRHRLISRDLGATGSTAVRLL